MFSSSFLFFLFWVSGPKKSAWKNAHSKIPRSSGSSKREGCCFFSAVNALWSTVPAGSLALTCVSSTFFAHNIPALFVKKYLVQKKWMCSIAGATNYLLRKPTFYSLLTITVLFHVVANRCCGICGAWCSLHITCFLWVFSPCHPLDNSVQNATSWWWF